MAINIHAAVSGNSLGYYRYMRANYEALASGENELRFFVYCLDASSERRLKGSGDIYQLHPPIFGGGSEGHAKCIEIGIANFVPHEVNVIADTDVVLFRPGWDKIVSEALKSKRLGMIGTRLEDVGGFSSGDTKYQQYKGKPTTTWFAASPHFDFSRLQVRPDKKNVIDVATPELSELYQLPIGFFVVKDTGWQIPSYLEENRIPYRAFEIVKPTSANAKAIAGTSPYHDEFHWDGLPFLAHQRGSMNHRFRIDPLSVDFYDACDRYLNSPAWAVHPSSADRIRAGAETIWRSGKGVLKSVARGRSAKVG